MLTIQTISAKVLTMKDFLGKNISVEDRVVFIHRKFKGGELKRGIVVGFSEKMVRLEMKDDSFTLDNSPVYSSFAPHNMVVVNKDV